MKQTPEVEDPQPDKVMEGILQWEYHRLKVRDTATLPLPAMGDLGRQGWELVLSLKHHADITFIFKRPKLSS